MKYKKSHPSCKLSCYYNAELFTILFSWLMTASLFTILFSCMMYTFNHFIPMFALILPISYTYCWVG